jgi:hypothetical protein
VYCIRHRPLNHDKEPMIRGKERPTLVDKQDRVDHNRWAKKVGLCEVISQINYLFESEFKAGTDTVYRGGTTSVGFCRRVHGFVDFEGLRRSQSDRSNKISHAISFTFEWTLNRLKFLTRCCVCLAYFNNPKKCIYIKNH